MITSLRRMFSSKLGVGLALAFLVLMGVSFAMADVQGMSSGGGTVSEGHIARVGREQIALNDVRLRFDAAYREAQQTQPGLTREAFAASGAFDRILREVTELSAVTQYADHLGISVDPSAVDAVIAQNPAFFGTSGRFDQATFEAALRSQGLTPDDLRNQIRTSMIARQLLAPGAQVAGAPEAMTDAYTSMLLERRFGRAVFVPAAQSAPQNGPDEPTLQSFFTSQRARYALPERRILRYAIFDPAASDVAVAVTDAEIAQRYEANRAQFAPTETRRFRQVIAGDRATADRIAAAARTGSLEAAARAAGLEASPVAASDQQQLARSTSADAARAAFALAPRGVAGPVAVPLGFAVLQLEAIDRQAGKSLAEASGELRRAIETEKRRAAVAQRFNTVQDAFGGGATLNEVAQANGLRVVETQPLAASAPGGDAEAVAVRQAGFSLQDGEPGRIVPIGEGDAQKFALIELARVFPSAPPPLQDIRDRVIADWRLDQGNRAARTKARAIAQAVERGTDLAAAARANGAGASVQPISGQRIATAGGRGVPPEIALLFSLAPGEARTLELPNRTGWMVIRADRSEAAAATSNPALRQAVKTQFGQALGSEMVETLLNAARRYAPISIDQAAVGRLRRELSGAAQPTN